MRAPHIVTHGVTEIATAPLITSASTVMLSLLFAFTGVGSALLGSALPALLAHWHLTDRDGGSLFLASWVGAALGALLSRGSPAASIGRGSALVAVSCLALIHARESVVVPLVFCYGLGLGITMTSISLLRSAREAARRNQELNRLNLIWGVGALSCPLLAARALFSSNAGYLFALLGCTFAALTVWVAVFELRLPKPTLALQPEGLDLRTACPAYLCAASALMGGIEASLGGWLATFAKRADHSVVGAVTAASAFWAGLLISRALHSSSAVRSIRAGVAIRGHVWLVALSALLLSLAHVPSLLPVFAFAAGFGLGPLYPMLLAAVLPRYRGNRVFLFAGVGASTLPWFTGLLSSRLGSLRAGLVVPSIAGVILLTLSGLMAQASEGGPEHTLREEAEA